MLLLLTLPLPRPARTTVTTTGAGANAALPAVVEVVLEEALDGRTDLLVHVLTGNRNKWLIGVVSLLLVANFGLILLAYAINQLYIQGHKTILNVFFDAAAVFLQFVPFSLSHFIDIEVLCQL